MRMPIACIRLPPIPDRSQRHQFTCNTNKQHHQIPSVFLLHICSVCFREPLVLMPSWSYEYHGTGIMHNMPQVPCIKGARKAKGSCTVSGVARIAGGGTKTSSEKCSHEAQCGEIHSMRNCKQRAAEQMVGRAITHSQFTSTYITAPGFAPELKVPMRSPSSEYHRLMRPRRQVVKRRSPSLLYRTHVRGPSWPLSRIGRITPYPAE